MNNNIIKNKDFFYLQYNKIDWKNQEKTKINSFIYKYILRNVILNHRGDSISIFDIGFGIGFFFKILLSDLKGKYNNVLIEGCEPSHVNYDYFLKKKSKKIPSGITINTHKKTFQDTEIDNKFDFITAIYVFPHFLVEDLENVVKKIYSMLKSGGKFILVLADEKYLKNKLKTEKDLYIETRNITYNNRQYKEYLHYTDIPKIGKVIDYNREEAFHLDLFKNNKFNLVHKENLNDNNLFAHCLFLKSNRRRANFTCSKFGGKKRGYDEIPPRLSTMLENSVCRTINSVQNKFALCRIIIPRLNFHLFDFFR